MNESMKNKSVKQREEIEAWAKLYDERRKQGELPPIENCTPAVIGEVAQDFGFLVYGEKWHDLPDSVDPNATAIDIVFGSEASEMPMPSYRLEAGKPINFKEKPKNSARTGHYGVIKATIAGNERTLVTVYAPDALWPDLQPVWQEFVERLLELELLLTQQRNTVVAEYVDELIKIFSVEFDVVDSAVWAYLRRYEHYPATFTKDVMNDGAYVQYVIFPDDTQDRNKGRLGRIELRKMVRGTEIEYGEPYFKERKQTHEEQKVIEQAWQEAVERHRPDDFDFMNPAHREAIEIALKYDTRYRLAELNVKQKINQEWLEVYEQYEVQWKEIVNGLQAWLVTQGMESKQLDQQKLFRASGVPANLYKQLRDVLLECDPFATDQELKAIFVDERLSLWRNQLPQANNPSTRVDQVIDFLYRHSSKAGENALVSLLHVLCDRHDEADACHQHLTDLANALEKEIKSRNDVIDQPMIVTKQPNQENEKVVVVKLPSRESDKQKWHQVWQKIREYAVQGWNANDIGREIQQHPNDYTNLPISSKTLRSIIAAGNAGLFD